MRTVNLGGQHTVVERVHFEPKMTCECSDAGENLYLVAMESYAKTCERYELFVEAAGIRCSAKRMAELEERLTAALASSQVNAS